MKTTLKRFAIILGTSVILVVVLAVALKVGNSKKRAGEGLTFGQRCGSHVAFSRVTFCTEKTLESSLQFFSGFNLTIGEVKKDVCEKLRGIKQKEEPPSLCDIRREPECRLRCQVGKSDGWFVARCPETFPSNHWCRACHYAETDERHLVFFAADSSCREARVYEGTNVEISDLSL